jgi:hypothetical protein
MTTLSIKELRPDSIPEGMKAVADIATRHLTETDGNLLRWSKTSARIIGYVGPTEYGWMLETAQYDEAMMDADLGLAEDIKRSGMSKTFVAIMSALYRQNIYYVCFDTDGYELAEFPIFDW